MARMVHDLCLYMCFQKQRVSSMDYYKTFKAIRVVLEVHGGRAGFHEGLFKEKLKEIEKESRLGPGDAATDEMQEKVMIST